MIKRVVTAVIILFLLIAGIIVFKTGLISGELPFVDGIPVGAHKADDSQGWNLILVNKDHYIPKSYKVHLTELSNGKKVDYRIYPELQRMFDAARADGLELYVSEGYRTTKDQQNMMNSKIKGYEEDGYSKSKVEKLAKEYVAIPGTSEHQLGLAVDINADTSKCSSDAVYTWLEQNSYKFGFIKRYPANKAKITGINNEPWHYRYVGKKAAKEMKEKDLCLEEYLKQLEK